MRLFDLCGFTKVENHIITSFNFINESLNEADRESKLGPTRKDRLNVTGTASSLFNNDLDSRDLMSEFNVNYRGIGNNKGNSIYGVYANDGANKRQQ